MKDFYKWLFESDWDFKIDWINKKTYGRISPYSTTVTINMRLMLIETLMHEYYHSVYPSASEQGIEFAARIAVYRLTVKQIYEITNDFMAIYGGL